MHKYFNTLALDVLSSVNHTSDIKKNTQQLHEIFKNMETIVISCIKWDHYYADNY